MRLVLTANMPGPWGEAAKAVLSARQVSYLPVAQAVMESNDELHAWTGVRNAPVAVLDEEPPLTTWLDILFLPNAWARGLLAAERSAESRAGARLGDGDLRIRRLRLVAAARIDGTTIDAKPTRCRLFRYGRE